MRVRAKAGPFPYGFRYRLAGQEFEMDDRHVSMHEDLGYVERVATVIKAELPDAAVEEAKRTRKKKKRTYKRRDLTAE